MFDQEPTPEQRKTHLKVFEEADRKAHENRERRIAHPGKPESPAPACQRCKNREWIIKQYEKVINGINDSLRMTGIPVYPFEPIPIERIDKATEADEIERQELIARGAKILTGELCATKNHQDKTNTHHNRH